MWELRYPEHADAIAEKRGLHNMAYSFFDSVGVSAEARAALSHTRVQFTHDGVTVNLAVVPRTGKPRPVVVLIHGGGGVLGDAVAGGGLLQTAYETDSVVVSVDYRTAPEHPYPAAFNDCEAAVRWAAKHAAEYGGDGERLAVLGLSMGGGLAAAVAAELRSVVKVQALVAPVLTYGATTKSYVEFGSVPTLPTEGMLWMWLQYAPDAQACKADPKCSPSSRVDLKGLPPAIIMTGAADALRDEGAEYAQRLKAAGVDVTYSAYRGTHISLLPRFDSESFDRFAAALRARLH
eukprot:TRINITY_DN6852_c0_g1_i1.p1 TRINITY_DN6852_c0_g1~~TRINITY_DN6852_c0_g1_i1.p1  ORF type:complete len:292 (+),score=87.44 TRINITY_DN6852_c0_g1_i1:236-1111(+)